MKVPTAALVVGIVVEAIKRISNEKRNRDTTGLHGQNVITIVNLHLIPVGYYCHCALSSAFVRHQGNSANDAELQS